MVCVTHFVSPPRLKHNVGPIAVGSLGDVKVEFRNRNSPSLLTLLLRAMITWGI